MKNTLIIISGMAAAGKTTFAEWLSQKLSISLLSLDELWEKLESNNIPFAQYWTNCEEIMKKSLPLIIEFGFWEEQKPMINELVEKYNYHAINIVFYTSIEMAHCRFNDRRKYNTTISKPQITLEQYAKLVEQSKNFKFGNCVIYVDTTNFLTVSYEDIERQIKEYTTRAVYPL